MPRNELASLLAEIIEVLESDGAFEVWACLTPEESGLPLIYDKLLRAQEMAEHFSRPEAGQSAPTSHRLQ